MLPAYGAREVHGSKLDKIVLACARFEYNLGGSVGFILVVVDIEANVSDTHSLDKVYGELVRLRAIRSKQMS